MDSKELTENFDKFLEEIQSENLDRVEELIEDAKLEDAFFQVRYGRK